MCVQYHGGYLEYRGGYHDKCGDILSNVGDTQYRGGYHDAPGDFMSTVGLFNTVGENLLLFEYPTVLIISPTGIMIPPRYS